MANTNIFYLDNSNNFQITTNSTDIKIEDMLQRLQTFKGEQGFNATNGIDYIAIFNKQSFLNPQIEAIISQYQQYFQAIDYTIGNVINGTITINMTIVLFSGDVVARTIIV